MIDQPFRDFLPNYTKSLVGFYKRLGLTPNQLTMAALILACLAATATAIGWCWLALLLWWCGRLLDGTDGIYARTYNLTSDFGAFLDILCDMASYSVMILGFAHLYPDYQMHWLLMVIFYVLCITGALALGAFERMYHLEGDNRGIRLAAGLAEGGETGIAYTLFLLFPVWIGITTKLWIIILFTTVVARTLLARRQLVAHRRKQAN